MLDYRMITFRTLYDEMNYRRTAGILNMTQPGVTQHIQYLEQHYGVKLFTYNGKILMRTWACEALRRYVDSVMAEERALCLSFAKPEPLLLHVGATKTIGEFVLPDIVNAFLSEKNHSLELVIDNTEALLKALERCDLDFAIVEGVFDKARYFHRLFKRERFVGICSSHHSFAGRRVPLEDLFSETLIVREHGSGTRALLERAIADRGFSLDRFRRMVTTGNFSVITDLVVRQNAITFAYAPIAQSRADLSAFEVEDMPISGEFNFVYCSENAAAKKIDLFMSGGSGSAE